MLNNIAVVLRGHLRTWEWNAPQAFEFYNSIAHNVDYYISTWATPELRTVKIDQTFADVNLVKKLYVDYQDREYTSWGGPALLSLHIVPHVRQQHRLTPYDVVFDTRPDVAPFRIEDIPITPIQENTLYTNAFTNLLDCKGDRNIGMKDHMLVSQFNVFEAMCDRVVIDSNDTRECHVEILDFAKKQGFAVSNSLNWMDAIMTRPSGFKRYPSCTDEVYNRNLFEDEEYPTWESCTIEQRLELLDMQNIEKIDYVTNNGNIAVEQMSDNVKKQFHNK
jgi:hypothetical protein